MLHLILGGAAVHRCDKRLVLNAALAAEGAPSAPEGFFPQPLKSCSSPSRLLPAAMRGMFQNATRVCPPAGRVLATSSGNPRPQIRLRAASATGFPDRGVYWTGLRFQASYRCCARIPRAGAA